MLDRAGRLAGLVAGMSAAWAAERERLGAVRDAETLAAADLAVARLRAAVELLADQLYLAAFARTPAHLSVQTLHLPGSGNLPGNPRHEGAAGGGLPGKLRELGALCGGQLGSDLAECAEPVAADAPGHRLGPRHPYAYTENALREEMGLDPRSRYGDT